MAINNDLLNDIISGLSSMPKKSEIDTPTHNIDLDATETESGLMSAADKKKLTTLDTDLSNLKTTVDGTVNMILALTSTAISDMPTCLGPDGETVEYVNEYDDIKAASIDYDILKVDGTKLSTIKTGGYVTRCYHPATLKHDGLMSVVDKTKLDNIEAGANNYKLPIASATTLGGVKTTSDVDDATGLTPVPIIDGIPYYKNTTEYELPIASATTLGGVKTTSDVVSTTGLTACPIIAGIPYYKDAQSTAVDYTNGIVFNTDTVEETYTTKILKIGCFVNFVINITVKEASTSLRVVIGTLPEQVRPIDNVVNNTVSNTGRGCYVYADTDGSFGFTLTEDSISSSSSTVSIDGWTENDGVRLNLTYLTNPD